MTHSNSFRCTMPPQALQNRKTSSPIRIDLLCLSFFRLRCSFRCRTPSTLPIASLLIFSSAVLCSLSELVYCTFGANIRKEFFVEETFWRLSRSSACGAVGSYFAQFTLTCGVYFHSDVHRSHLAPSDIFSIFTWTPYFPRCSEVR